MPKTKASKPSPAFEDYLPIIDKEISKHKNKWVLSSITWMDYEDVAQIIRLHIFRKWSQYDPSRPIQPWLNIIISHQIKNIIRNVYSNYARPCLKCDAAEDELGCKIYGSQCSSCPLYKAWEKKKKHAYNINLAVSMENHHNEVHEIFDNSFDVIPHINEIHEKMRKVLKPFEYKIYEGLFILHETELVVAKKLGYISNEKGRAPGYRQIIAVKKSIIEKMKKLIRSGEIDIYTISQSSTV
jgi:hypothetical protein